MSYDLDNFIMTLRASDVSFFSTLAEVVTIWGFVYALPNFVKQIRAENATVIAGKALELWSDLNRNLRMLAEKSAESRDEIIGRFVGQLSRLVVFIGLLKLDPKRTNPILELQHKFAVPKKYTHVAFLHAREILESSDLERELKTIYSDPISISPLWPLKVVAITFVIYIFRVWF